MRIPSQSRPIMRTYGASVSYAISNAYGLRPTAIDCNPTGGQCGYRDNCKGPCGAYCVQEIPVLGSHIRVWVWQNKNSSNLNCTSGICADQWVNIYFAQQNLNRCFTNQIHGGNVMKLPKQASPVNAKATKAETPIYTKAFILYLLNIPSNEENILIGKVSKASSVCVNFWDSVFSDIFLTSWQR